MIEHEGHVGEKVDLLLKNSLVSEVLGKLPPTPKIGLILWAHRPPGNGFDLLIRISEYISGHTPTVFIDDLLPREFFHRNYSEQMATNEAYSNYFKSRGCGIVLLSQMEEELYPGQYLDFTERISVNDFIHLLPERKSRQNNSLSLNEVLFAINNLFSFEVASAKLGLNTTTVPQFNKTVFMLHRRISNCPMTGLVTPRFGEAGDIASKIASLDVLEAQDK